MRRWKTASCQLNYLINFCWLDKNQFSFLLLGLELKINIVIYISKNLSMT